MAPLGMPPRKNRAPREAAPENSAPAERPRLVSNHIQLTNGIETTQNMKTTEQLEAEAAEIDKALTEAVESKNYAGLADLERRVTALADARFDLERKQAADANPNYAATRNWGGDAGSQPDPAISGTALGALANPLRLDQKALATVHQAMSRRQSVETKAFSTLDSLIPAQLDPNILPKIHEHRLLDYLPVLTISAPSYEIIVHSSTTGAPTPVAEGAAKPGLVLNTTALTLTAIKLSLRPRSHRPAVARPVLARCRGLQPTSGRRQ
jgi:HK97 family phage major capsid protein